MNNEMEQDEGSAIHHKPAAEQTINHQEFVPPAAPAPVTIPDEPAPAAEPTIIDDELSLGLAPATIPDEPARDVAGPAQAGQPAHLHAPPLTNAHLQSTSPLYIGTGRTWLTLDPGIWTLSKGDSASDDGNIDSGGSSTGRGVSGEGYVGSTGSAGSNARRARSICGGIDSTTDVSSISSHVSSGDGVASSSSGASGVGVNDGSNGGASRSCVNGGSSVVAGSSGEASHGGLASGGGGEASGSGSSIPPLANPSDSNPPPRSRSAGGQGRQRVDSGDQASRSGRGTRRAEKNSADEGLGMIKIDSVFIRILFTSLRMSCFIFVSCAVTTMTR
jgi:hypothetical protein